jgi:tetratricopeptide (TPR) repeat protein
MDTNEWKGKPEDFQRRLKQNPRDGLLWLDYAEFLDEECDNPEKTSHAFERAQQLLPDVDIRPRIGTAYDRAGEFGRGIALIQESLKETPRPSGYCILADVYLRNDMNHEAIHACQKALELDQDYEEAYYLLGEAVRHSSRERAIQYYHQAIMRDPDYQLAWQTLGRELVAGKDTIEDGILALCRAVELNPEDGWAKIFLANALARLGKDDEADESYKAAIAAFPEYPAFRTWYAEFLSKRAGLTDKQE